MLLFALLAVTGISSAQNQRCIGPPHWMKGKLKEQAPWLVSTTLRKHIAKRSPEFGSLVEFQQQCRWSDAISLTNASMEGRQFTVFISDGVPLRFIFGRYRDVWTMAVVPINPKDDMPEANLLEITEHEWTLFHREKDGSREVLATEHY